MCLAPEGALPARQGKSEPEVSTDGTSGDLHVLQALAGCGTGYSELAPAR